MKFRRCDLKKDRAALTRIWQEAGWIEKDEQEEKALAHVLEGGKVHIADIRKEAECMVQTMAKSIRLSDRKRGMEEGSPEQARAV
jgi:hypothetical protein